MIGFTLGGIGLAAAGAGGVFGALAIAQRNDAERACPAAPCSTAALQSNTTGVAYAWISDLAVGAGLVALGVGTVLVLTAPSRGSTSGGAAHAVVAWTGTGAAVKGEF